MRRADLTALLVPIQPVARKPAAFPAIIAGPLDDSFYRDAWHPPVIQRHVRSHRVFEVIALSLVIVLVFLTGQRLELAGLLLPAACLPVGSIIISREILRRRSQRLVALVRANGLEHCPHCGYQLTGLPEKHRCPECGSEFELHAVRERWRAYLAVPAKSDPYVLRSFRQVS